MSRIVVAKNKSRSSEILMEETFMTGRRGSRILLPPLTRREFAASKFCNNNIHALQASIIVLYVDRKKARQCLTPEQFRQYVQLNFNVDDAGRLTVTGIEPRWTDFRRLWGLGIFGRSYEGRPEEIVRSY